MPTDQSPSSDTTLALLARSAAALARGADLDTTLEAMLTTALQAVGGTVAAVFVQDPDRPALELASAFGLADRERRSFEREVAGNPAHPIAVAARTRAAVFDRTGVGAEGGPTTSAHLPLVVGRGGVDLPLGVVSFGWAGERASTERERAICVAVADMIATALDRGRLASLVAERSEWFERMAHTDPLTGLASGRTFARILELEVARASRQGGEVSVAVFDVDDFSAVNEAAGHEAGDDVLRAVASVLAETVRLVDTVARYGGDEFVLVAPGSAGATVARRVMDGVAALAPVDGRRVSICAGVARFPSEAGSAEELLAAAEAALKRAQEAGTGQLASAPVRTAG